MNPDHKKKHTSFISLISTLFRQGLHFFYEKLIEPKSTTEDDHRHEYILNIILTGFITLLGILDILLVISHITDGRTQYGTPFWIFSLFIIIFTGFLYISRKGLFVISSYALIILQYILITYTVFHWGIEIPLAILSYVVVIIISSILISTRTSFIVTVIISATIIILGYCEVSGITPVDLGWKSLPILTHDAWQFTGAFFLITILTWLSNREIESSLSRARNSERALITERNNLEIVVEERTREIKSLQAEKVAQLYRSAEFGRLSSGLFHDLMNPLNALIGNVDRMKSNPHNISEVETYLEKSVTASRRMGEFLGSIRKQMSRHEIVERFSCGDEVVEVCEILAYRAREAGVTLQIIQIDEVNLLGNSLKFHQIIINLVANAIDSYKNISRKNLTVEISLTKKDDSANIIITDYGSGISTDLIETIFDPFFTTKDPCHGTGLGLSTTKNIVTQDFNGTIQVISTEHIGSTFVVTIPLN
jgi:signal transduction histidine kinase